MRIVAPLVGQQHPETSSTNKKISSAAAPAPEMRRAKSGDHLRRPRSHTSTQPIPEQARSRPSRPPSQIIGEKAVAKHRSTVSANAVAGTPVDAWRAVTEQKFTQEMFEREKSMELIRREKSMDVRLESRLLMEREYRNSMGKPLASESTPYHQQHPLRVRSEKSSPRTTPPQSLARNNSSERASLKNSNNSSRDSSLIADPSTSNSNASSRVLPHSLSNNSNFSQQHQQQQQRHPNEELRRGGSVAAAREGMSYRQVFGLQASDYLFNVTPPNYTRHRRFSDSDTESLHNFNFIHKVIQQPSSTATSSASTITNNPSQSTQQLPNMGATNFSSQTPMSSAPSNAATVAEDASKSKMQPKKWMKKVRRKSEDNPKRKVVAQLSNK